MPLNLPGGSTLQCGMWLWDDMPWNSPKRPPYWNSTSRFEFDDTTAVDMSLCTSLRNCIQIGPPSAEKMTSCRFLRRRISAILDFGGPIMGSLKSPCTTSYRSSMETIALNCLGFEKIAFLQFGDRQTDKQTNKQTNRWTGPMHEAALAVASGGLIIILGLTTLMRQQQRRRQYPANVYGMLGTCCLLCFLKKLLYIYIYIYIYTLNFAMKQLNKTIKL